jgi:hypothetical protein
MRRRVSHNNQTSTAAAAPPAAGNGRSPTCDPLPDLLRSAAAESEDADVRQWLSALAGAPAVAGGGARGAD